MPTQVITVTSDWKDISTAASLVADSTYLLGSVGNAKLYMYEDTTMPTNQLGTPLQAEENIGYVATATESLWARCAISGASTSLSVSSAT